VYAVPSEADLPDETPAEMLVKKLWGLVTALGGLGFVKAVRRAINPPVAAVIAGGCSAAGGWVGICF
jgi:hypothetical protein